MSLSQSSPLALLRSQVTVADRPERTLRAPPLHFRRRPPQSNYPPDTVRVPDHGHALGTQYGEGSIPRLPPRGLAPPLHRLLPILYTPYRMPMPSCSKGSRGLSVLPREARIFTNNAISPGPWLRQRPSRCAVRAGRNLPDKEFRYLRTVIVTAAVYWGLASRLRSKELTHPRDLPAPGRRQTLYIALRLNAESCVFGKQSLGPIHCGSPGLRWQAPSPRRAPLLPKLRGDFAEFLNHGLPDRLGMLYPPTCVGFGTGADVSS